MALIFKSRAGATGKPGALATYLKYALGEIVLVVVGILIALQINDWYQERLDRQTEREYLVSMTRDLAEDSRELREAIEGNQSLLVGLDNPLRLLAEPRDDDAWRRDLYLHGIKYTYWFVVMEFSRLTMAQLQYSGSLRLPEGQYLSTEDPSLIADYYDDMLYHRTALNILTLMYQRQLRLAGSLSTLIEAQYGIRDDEATR